MMSRAERRSLSLTRQLLGRALAPPAFSLPAFARVRSGASVAVGAPARQSCGLWTRAQGAETGGAAGAGVRRVSARSRPGAFEEEVVELELPLPVGAGGVSRSASLGLTDCSNHPGGNPGANLKSISHTCHPILVACVWELTQETIELPLGCLLGGSQVCSTNPVEQNRARSHQNGEAK